MNNKRLRGYNTEIIAFYMAIFIASISVFLIKGPQIIKALVSFSALALWLIADLYEKKKKSRQEIWPNRIELIFIVFFCLCMLGRFIFDFNIVWIKDLYLFLLGGAFGSRLYIIDLYRREDKNPQKKNK